MDAAIALRGVHDADSAAGAGERCWSAGKMGDTGHCSAGASAGTGRHWRTQCRVDARNRAEMSFSAETSRDTGHRRILSGDGTARLLVGAARLQRLLPMPPAQKKPPSIAGHLFTQYPGQEQVELNVKIDVPGSCVHAHISNVGHAAARLIRCASRASRLIFPPCASPLGSFTSPTS